MSTFIIITLLLRRCRSRWGFFIIFFPPLLLLSRLAPVSVCCCCCCWAPVPAPLPALRSPAAVSERAALGCAVFAQRSPPANQSASSTAPGGGVLLAASRVGGVTSQPGRAASAARRAQRCAPAERPGIPARSLLAPSIPARSLNNPSSLPQSLPRSPPRSLPRFPRPPPLDGEIAAHPWRAHASERQQAPLLGEGVSTQPTFLRWKAFGEKRVNKGKLGVMAVVPFSPCPPLGAFHSGESATFRH